MYQYFFSQFPDNFNNAPSVPYRLNKALKLSIHCHLLASAENQQNLYQIKEKKKKTPRDAVPKLAGNPESELGSSSSLFQFTETLSNLLNKEWKCIKTLHRKFVFNFIRPVMSIKFSDTIQYFLSLNNHLWLLDIEILNYIENIETSPRLLLKTNATSYLLSCFERKSDKSWTVRPKLQQILLSMQVCRTLKGQGRRV